MQNGSPRLGAWKCIFPFRKLRKQTNKQTDRKSPRKIKLSREKFTLAAACGVRRRASLEQERCQRRVVVVHRYMQRRYAVLPLCINRGFL